MYLSTSFNDFFYTSLHTARPIQPSFMSLSNMLSTGTFRPCTDFSFLPCSLCASQRVKSCIHPHGNWLHHASRLVSRDQPGQQSMEPNQSILLPPRSQSRGGLHQEFVWFLPPQSPRYFKQLVHNISWVRLCNRGREEQKTLSHCQGPSRLIIRV